MINTSSNGQIQYTLTILTQELEENSAKLEASLIRLAGYLSRMSGSEDIRKFINTVQDAMIAVRSMQQTIQLFYAASGPIGWIIAGTSAVTTAFAVSTMVTGVDPNVYNIERAYG